MHMSLQYNFSETTTSYFPFHMSCDMYVVTQNSFPRTTWLSGIRLLLNSTFPSAVFQYMCLCRLLWLYDTLKTS